jgi:hypothetical protein
MSAAVRLIMIELLPVCRRTRPELRAQHRASHRFKKPLKKQAKLMISAGYLSRQKARVAAPRKPGLLRSVSEMHR